MIGILNSLCHREWGRYSLPVMTAEDCTITSQKIAQKMSQKESSIQRTPIHRPKQICSAHAKTFKTQLLDVQDSFG